MKEAHKQSAKPDFISSLILCIVSVIIILLSVAMPKYEEWGLYATPALAPIVFTLLMLICSLMMLVRSILAGGYKIRVTKTQVVRFFQSSIFRHFMIALILVYLYYFFLGKLHFVLISSLYLFLNILYYRSTAWWKNLILSVVFTGTVWFLFDYVFLIPLP